MKELQSLALAFGFLAFVFLIQEMFSSTVYVLPFTFVMFLFVRKAHLYHNLGLVGHILWFIEYWNIYTYISLFDL